MIDGYPRVLTTYKPIPDVYFNDDFTIGTLHESVHPFKLRDSTTDHFFFLIYRLYVRVGIFLTCGKHLHDRIISLRGKVWAHKTSL